MTLKETVEWLSAKSIDEKIFFYEKVLFDLTIMNRAIWSTDSVNQIECLKLSNELSHRIWNLLNDLKRKVDDNSEVRFGKNVKFYAKQSKELSGFISGTFGSYVSY